MTYEIQYSGIVSWRRFWRAQWKHVGWRWLILFSFPVIMTIASAVLPGASGSYVTTFFVSSVFVPVMLIFWAFQWRRIYLKSPYLHERIEGVLSADKFVAESSIGRTEMAWSKFVKIKEGSDFMLLYHSPYMFNILAREFFETDEHWKAAKRLAAPSAV